MTPAHNSAWIACVRHRLGQGYGTEDIALSLGCDIEDVRREVQIYRDEGRIAEVCRQWVK